MPSLLRTLTLTAAALAILTISAMAAQPQIHPGRVIIKLKPQAAQTAKSSRSPMATGLGTLDQLNVRKNIQDMRMMVPMLADANASAASRDVYGLARFYVIELEPGTDVMAAVAEYAADPNVELAEPDYVMPLDLVPNDPEYGQQWTHFHPQDKDIDTEEAWELETGDSTVVVGVIDSGIEFEHEDLKANIWVNPGEDLDGDGDVYDADDMDGLDSDGNGLIDDLIGWDFLGSASQACWSGEDCNAQDKDPSDFAGHGTHVNGIIASVTSNGVGVAGIAGGNRAGRRAGVKLMGLRAGYLADDGIGYVEMSACAAACNYAVAKGAMGINCSWGSSGAAIQTAVLNAVANGLVVCKAAGNDNVDAPDILATTAGVLAVASYDVTGVKSSFTNYGTWVDISAPGAAIYNTFSNLGSATYATLSGTSMASPTVLGVAALLKSHHTWFTKTQIDTLLLNYTEDIYTQNPSYVGKLGTGRLNALNSLSILTTADYDIDTNFGFAPLTITFTNTSPNAPDAPYLYEFGDGNTSPNTDEMHTYDTAGIYTVRFTGNGPSGPHTRTNIDQIVIVQDTVEYGDTLGLSVGENFSIPIRLHNTHPMTDITLPIKLSGPADIRLDSLTLTALTAGWENSRVLSGSTQSAWRLKALGTGTPIPKGGGIIGHFWLHVVSGSSGQVEVLDSGTVGIAQHTLRLISSYADFKPRFIGGSATVGGLCDCSCHGDPVCDGVATVTDVVNVVNVAFRNGTDTVDPTCTHIGRSDMNCDCIVSVLDVVAIVNRAFRNDTSPQCDGCAQPCP